MRQILFPVAAATLATLLASCASAPIMPMGQGEPLAWVRTDGQSGRANPELVDQFAADRTACGIGGTEDNAALRGAEPCMNRLGYVLVPASQAEATAAGFRGSAGYATPAG